MPHLRRDAAQARVAAGHGRGPQRHRDDAALGDAMRSPGTLAPGPLTDRDNQSRGRSSRRSAARLGFLVDVGLDYLTLDRASGTLSGGEAQRIRLATQIGSSLMGVLYILDEPSIGLHQRDNARLIATLVRLRDLGNTLIVVEHDEDTIRHGRLRDRHRPRRRGARRRARRAGHARRADRRTTSSLTGAYLRGAQSIPVPPTRGAPERRAGSTIDGARENNLQRHRRRVPARPVRRASPACRGSGKSTLVTRCSTRRWRRSIWATARPAGEHDRIDGLEQIDKVIEIDQSPIGRTPRSNPATYTGLFDAAPRAFRRTSPRPRLAATSPGRFSFNVKGGRCEACEGDGHHADRDALPARRLRPVRGLQGQALQPRDARDPLQGQERRRRARDDRRGGAASSSSTSRRSRSKLQTLARRRPGLRHARASRRRRSPAARRSA